MSDRNVTLGDAAATIAVESPEAAKLMLDLVEHSRNANADLMQSLYEGEVRRNEELRAEVAALRRRIYLIEWRHDWLCGRVETPEPWDEP